jgi:PTH1 family peptidyl-tRNA hydrolase
VKIITGLGNPGRTYSETRHNAGWIAVNKLAARCGAREEELRCGGLRARCGELWLFKPLSYMNLCGPPVACMQREAGVELQDILILVDDLDLPLGRIRLRPGGSSGGHNGLTSLIEALGTEEFPRLRMGIGPCPPDVGGRDFVLSPFGPDEWPVVETMTDEAADAALCWAKEGIEAAMTRFNRKERDE